ncbi:ARM repeat superfamily protein isoform X2 [Wolffia australiana]
MASELEELLGFLSSSSPQLRKGAVEIVSGLTGSEEGLRALVAYADVAIPALLNLLQDSVSGKEVQVAAAEALVNLSQDEAVCEKLAFHGAVAVSEGIIFKPERRCDNALSRLLVMLLANLTQIDSGVLALLQVGDEKLEGLFISKLVRSFCSSSVEESSGSILVNISKAEAGRKILLHPKRRLLKQIVQQMDSTNPLRKKGVSGTIRNCCFEADKQVENLLLMSEFLWPALLLPVAGKKIYGQEDTSKMPLELANPLEIEREVTDDPEIRIQALEAIYLIVLQDTGRKAFWGVNGPRILEVGYQDEEDPRVMEAYERVGSLLVTGGDEAGDQ